MKYIIHKYAQYITLLCNITTVLVYRNPSKCKYIKIRNTKQIEVPKPNSSVRPQTGTLRQKMIEGVDRVLSAKNINQKIQNG